MRPIACNYLTWDAPVVGVKVRRKILRAGLSSDERRIGDAEVAGLSARTGLVEQGRDVGGTAEVAVVTGDAPTQFHPTEGRFVHDDDLVGGAFGVKRLRQAIFFTSCA